MEGTHYTRKLDRSSHNNYGSKKYVDCLLCGVLSDSVDDIVKRKCTRKNVNQGIRLGMLMIHYKGKHQDAFPSEGRSLLDLGFTVASVVDDAITSEADMWTDESVRLETVASRIWQPPPRLAGTSPIPIAIAEIDMQVGQPFGRYLTRQVDTVIKANCIAQVIPSAHAIAMEVLRQQHENNVEEHRTSVSRERWTQQTTVPDMVRESRLAFRGTDDGGLEAYCPVCLKHRVGDGRR